MIKYDWKGGENESMGRKLALSAARTHRIVSERCTSDSTEFSLIMRTFNQSDNCTISYAADFFNLFNTFAVRYKWGSFTMPKLTYVSVLFDVKTPAGAVVKVSATLDGDTDIAIREALAWADRLGAIGQVALIPPTSTANRTAPTGGVGVKTMPIESCVKTTTKGGDPVIKLGSGIYNKFGIPCYADVFEATLAYDEWTDFHGASIGTMRVSFNEMGNPVKVLAIELD